MVFMSASEEATSSTSTLDSFFEGLPSTLTVGQAANVFNLSEHIIREAITADKPGERLPALRLGRGYVIIRADFERWIRSRYSGS